MVNPLVLRQRRDRTSWAGPSTEETTFTVESEKPTNSGRTKQTDYTQRRSSSYFTQPPTAPIPAITEVEVDDIGSMNSADDEATGSHLYPTISNKQENQVVARSTTRINLLR
jgi:hypothetical protein